MASPLPAPEVDITKTVWFADFEQSGGPFRDAVLSWQITTIHVLQDVRKTQAQISVKTYDPGAPDYERPKKKVTSSEITAITAEPTYLLKLCDIGKAWERKEGQAMITTATSKSLGIAAQSFFTAIKDSYNDDVWDNPDLMIQAENRQFCRCSNLSTRLRD